MADPEISYTPLELRSYLPTGWSVDEASPPGWSIERGAWIATVRDGSDLTWEVRVDADSVEADGRLPALGRALRRAFHRR